MSTLRDCPACGHALPAADPPETCPECGTAVFLADDAEASERVDVEGLEETIDFSGVEARDDAGGSVFDEIGADPESVFEEPDPPAPSDSFPNFAALMAGAAADEFRHRDVADIEEPVQDGFAANDDTNGLDPIDHDAETVTFRAAEASGDIEESLSPVEELESTVDVEPTASWTPDSGSAETRILQTSPADEETADEETADEETADEVAADEESESMTTSVEESPGPAAPTVPTPAPPTVRPSARAATVPRSWFVLAMTYASVVTILLVGLLFDIRNGGLALRWLDPPPHQLESLPDFANVRDLKIVPEDAELPAGHQLRIGDDRRFGNLNLRVVGVTREPVRIEYRDILGNPAGEDVSDVPVLKLWLEIENVSEQQSIAPFDHVLLFARGRTKGSDSPRGNQFVCRAEEQHPGGELVRPFLMHEGEFVGLDLGRSLHPGDSGTWYLPCSEDGVEELNGELVWRVQFRKGYGPETGKGVTTLVDIRFHSDEIETITEPDV